ncbi:MAG: GNAT family N-acetyltransferase [Bacilli bacterium]|nr:GNAT family N-acetyltransferase [Bacilli bacterium]
MYYVNKERQDIIDKINSILLDKFGVEEITTSNISQIGKDCFPNVYAKTINAIHYLFNNGDLVDDAKIYLSLKLRFNSNVEFDKNDFSKEEWDFLNQCKRNEELYGNYDIFTNVNESFNTERLTLGHITKNDAIALKQSLKEEGEEVFKNFFLASYDKFDEKCDACFTDRYLKFGVYLNNKIIGLCGLEPIERPTIYNLFYFIIKEERNKGYAYEATSAIIKKAFNGELYENKPELIKYSFKKEVAIVERIRLCPLERNIPSIKLAKKLGAYNLGINENLVEGDDSLKSCLYTIYKD